MARTTPKKSSASSNKLTSGIAKVKGQNFYRDAKAAARVKLLTGGKPIRDKAGNVVQAAAFQKGEEFAKPGRVQPDRRWFGNTRVISQDALEHFRTTLSVKKDDPYSVLLRRNKLPMSLLDDSHVGQKRPHIVETEPFQETFGPKAQRKKPRIEVGSFEELSQASQQAGDTHTLEEDAKAAVAAAAVDASVVEGGYLGSSFVNGPTPGPSKPQGWTAHGAMSAVSKGYAPMTEPVFGKGTSRRIYGELYKVIDSSDVIIHVLDARDPLGTLCRNVVDFVRKEKAHKQIVYLINKVDLVPGWVTQRYVSYLTPQAPTLAFHASQTHSFGKGALIQLLRQFSQLHSDRKQISIGFVGYPNVGKSSIINCLKAGKVCNVAPIPGETKVWQYITLMRRIYLIDCPGIVPASAQDSQTSKVLKGVVRVENLAQPSEHIPALLERVRPVYLERTYGLEGLLEKSVKTTAMRDDANPLDLSRWNSDAFLDAVAKKSGRLLKGGEPDRETVAKMVLNDWIRGKIPYFIRPPDSANFLQAAAQEKPGFVVKPKTTVEEREEVPAAVVEAPVQDEDAKMDEWNGVVGDGDNGGVMDDWSDTDGSDVDSDAEVVEQDESKVAAPKKKKKVKREPRELFVQQDIRGIVTKPKFLRDDKWDDEQMEVEEDGAEGDVGGDLDEASDDAEDAVEEDAVEEDNTENAPLRWDDVMAAVDSAPGPSDEAAPSVAEPKSQKSKEKQKAVEPVEDDDSGKYGKTVKEPRMATNKRKATNFFTTANVKNRNRDKKIPQPIKIRDRGPNGSRKAGGKGGKKR